MNAIENSSGVLNWSVIGVGRTDTAQSSLRVPALDLIVAGDTAYDGIHPCLVDTNVETRPAARERRS
ncbi:hypothetical protein P0R31_06845 [Bradyrhizobium yuanmingense]|uniref:hypothetical protein n=1 Tax=Bradyrhizobium yuanmingense TaxID=108015 RepID=UPI0023B9A701|nr:hypothetical protein [Bradyrhizobium yuanmingense]MDF0516943.1 hypothetical protein [Bradyrhizobium yuanmingense]